MRAFGSAKRGARSQPAVAEAEGARPSREPFAQGMRSRLARGALQEVRGEGQKRHKNARPQATVPTAITATAAAGQQRPVSCGRGNVAQRRQRIGQAQDRRCGAQQQRDEYYTRDGRETHALGILQLWADAASRGCRPAARRSQLRTGTVVSRATEAAHAQEAVHYLQLKVIRACDA